MSTRRAVNLSFDSDLLDEAKGYGLNLSKTLEPKLMEALREERTRRWKEANRSAIQEANQELERNGLWSDGLRLF